MEGTTHSEGLVDDAGTIKVDGPCVACNYNHDHNLRVGAWMLAFGLLMFMPAIIAVACRLHRFPDFHRGLLCVAAIFVLGGGIWLLGSPDGRDEPVFTVRRVMRVLILVLVAQYLVAPRIVLSVALGYPTLSLIVPYAVNITVLLIWALLLIYARWLARTMGNCLLGRRFAYLLAAYLAGVAAILLLLYGPPALRRPMLRFLPSLSYGGNSSDLTTNIVSFSVALLWYVCLTSAAIRLYVQLKRRRQTANRPAVD